ncbi:MAG: histidinol-phosphatase HisJ family protein [Erysipelotrichaceae bacterium]|nr:histidinol-phosphatase HisJ family protein [Erysipelotrichaceae bacterium]
MFADYHVHCEFSDDSRESMENQIRKGIELGLEEICFTDHVDYGIELDWDDPRGIEWRSGDGMSYSIDEMDPLANVNYPEYFGKLLRMKATYGDKITIRTGLEFGIQSITVEQYEKLFETYRKELDFVLFSMHQVNNLEFWTQDFQKGKTQKEYNEEYYKEILKTMKLFKNYSVLAHLDLLVRYDKAGIYPFEKVKDIIAEILKQAIRDDKGIEVNTSSFHYGLSDTQPSRNILKLYKDLGGRIITVGSDAHRTEYLADHIRDVYNILKDEIGFKEITTYDHMNPVFYPL